MVLAHGGHFAVYMFPVLAAVVLWITLRGDATKRKQSLQNRQGPSVPTLPRTEVGRQVWKATRPPRSVRKAAAPKPKFAPLSPEAKVAPFRPPRARDRIGS
jgi:hypothetical protein